MDNTIIFPNLHITLSNIGKTIRFFKFPVAYYGIVISIGMLVGVFLILKESKRLGKSEDQFLDLCIYTIIAAVVGARAYYVIFSWDYYKENLSDIVKLRQGGLGIYGGILVGMLTLFILCKIKKISFLETCDICILGVIVGQIFGRWGNFFNREAFGGYCDGVFAMQLPLSAVRSQDDITAEMISNIKLVDGVPFVSVHPTFLYESLWNLGLFVIMMLCRKHKKFDGQILCIYMAGYGIGRFLIEGLRTDQLKVWGTNVAVSQVVAVLMIIAAIIITIVSLLKLKKAENAIT